MPVLDAWFTPPTIITLLTMFGGAAGTVLLIRSQLTSLREDLTEYKKELALLKGSMISKNEMDLRFQIADIRMETIKTAQAHQTTLLEAIVKKLP